MRPQQVYILLGCICIKIKIKKKQHNKTKFGVRSKFLYSFKYIASHTVIWDFHIYSLHL